MIDRIFAAVLTGLVCSGSSAVIGMAFIHESYPVGILCGLAGFIFGATTSWKRGDQ